MNQSTGVVRPFKAEVDVALHGAWQGVFHHVHGQGRQIASLQRHGGATALGPRQGQQLVHRVGGTHAGAANLLQGLLQIIGVGVGALRQIGLHAQTGQWRFQLVRGIGQKTFLRGDRVLQARQQIVDGRDQRQHLGRHHAFIEWAHVVGFAFADAVFELIEWLDATRQGQPNQQHGQRQDDKQRQHHALDDFLRQHRALFQGFGHLHQHRSRLRVFHPHPDVGHADRRAFEHIVAHVQFFGHQLLVVIRWRQSHFAA